MLNDVQSKRIEKYRKLARKNSFCRYIAIIMLVINVCVSKFFSFHKRRFAVLGQLGLVVFVFFCNTSFAPPTFGASSETVTVAERIEETAPQTVVYTEDADTHFVDEHKMVNTSEDVANLDDLIEKNKDSVVADETKTATFVFDKEDWKLLLINKQHTIPEEYQFTLGTIKGSMRCDERIIDPLTQMFAAAKEDGVNLGVCSPYRDMERQEYLFDRKVKSYQQSGMSYIDAYKQACFTVTVPGASEHQVGLAVDIISDTYTSLDIGFADTDAGKWLKEHSWEYGFILRYPEGKEEITGIQYEPWHFRYVGVDAARVITSQNITLEEFVENL